MLDNGTVLQARYRVVKPLGQGGMGAVYRAWDLRLKVPVAVKEMRPQPGLDAAMLEGLRHQFEQEAAILARLSHPNLVRVTDYFEEGGFAYLVMDFVEGQSLAEVITQRGSQSEAQVLMWAQQLLDALEYCHGQGVIHRDIKPQNIIIKPDGRVVLVDFGLVKLWDPTDPRTKTVMRGMGTPEYAPPEQYGASADHTGPSSDIYSVGATLYHALTGQAPPTATERMALPEQFAPLSRLVPGVNPNTERVVMRALALPQAERWHGAQAMKTALSGGGQDWGRAPVISEPMGRGHEARPTYSPQVTPHYGEPARPSSQPMPPSPTMQASFSPQAFSPQASSPSSFSPTPASSPPRRKGKWLTWAAGIGGALVCIAVVCFGLLLLLSSDGYNGGTSTPPATIDFSTSVAQDARFGLTLRNLSNYDICNVYICPSGSTEWYESRLDAGEVLMAGDSQVFDAPEDEYDVLVRACDSAVMASAWQLTGLHEITIGGAGASMVRVRNRGEADICYVYISSVDDDSWGVDWLGGLEVIPTGDERLIFVEPGVYDMLARDCGEEDLAARYDVALDGELLWVVEK